MTLPELAADFRRIANEAEASIEKAGSGWARGYFTGESSALMYCARALEREIAPEVVREQLRASVEALSGKED